MSGKFAYKAPGGKMLKVSVDCDGCIVSNVRINGDFFAHPEDSIDKLEKELSGKRLDEMEDALNKFIKQNNTILYGISTADLAYAIGEAAR